MVIAGMGLSCLPEHLIGQDVLAGDLKRLPPEQPIAEIDVFLAWHKERKLSAAEQAFVIAFERFLDRTPLEMRAG